MMRLAPQRVTATNRIARAIWVICWMVLYRPTPVPFHGWRRFLLRVFGAKIGRRAHPYPSVRIWAPWNLEMGDDSGMGPNVDCYSVAPIVLGRGAAVSQYSYLCAATHDLDDTEFPLMVGSIEIGAEAWIAADAFIGPGVRIGDRAVVGARSSVFRDVEAGVVVAGSPARYLRMRGKRA
jgi:putative colanic acid biosynthesis acetyltransferase WcaF